MMGNFFFIEQIYYLVGLKWKLDENWFISFYGYLIGIILSIRGYEVIFSFGVYRI